MVKNTFLLIFSDPEIVFSLCFVCLNPEIKFLTAKNLLLTFQMEQNRMFLDNFKYDCWILHKKLV